MPDTTAEQFADSLFADNLHLMEVAAIWLGSRLGWYAALQAAGSCTAEQLAKATSSNPRYAREWLEQQATAGVLERDGELYSLPSGAAEVLLDRDSPNHIEPLVRQTVAAVLQLPAIADAYRSGGGVSWAQYGPDMSDSQGDMNRPLLLHSLPAEWTAQVPGLQHRLESGARVADFCCGQGWSAIGLARAFPGVTVDGFDVDLHGLDRARRNAEEHGVADRVTFYLADLAQPVGEGGEYDVCLAVECVHDLPRPVEVLRTMRRALREDGFAIVIDEAAEPELSTPGTELERVLYGFSLLVCLPDSMSTPGSVATGTVIRESTLSRYAADAGFAGVQAQPVDDTGLWRIYRLRT